MKNCIYILLLTLFASCGQNETTKELSASDSLVINFNIPQSNHIEKRAVTAERKAIKKMAQFVDGKELSQMQCNYDGNILFYQKGVVKADISFNYSSKECRHFMRNEANQLKSLSMSNEAADFLKSLYEGVDWY